MSLLACPGSATSFHVTATCSEAIAYRWQVESPPVGTNDWTNLTDGPLLRSGVVVGSGTGSNTSQFIFQDGGSNLDNIRFRCVATNTFGSAVSESRPQRRAERTTRSGWSPLCPAQSPARSSENANTSEAVSQSLRKRKAPGLPGAFAKLRIHNQYEPFLTVQCRNFGLKRLVYARRCPETT